MSDPLADHLARTAGKSMIARDPAFAAQGLRLESLSPGQACVEMKVRADMVNALGLCSGAFVFLLAENAFLYAANSRNRRGVSQQSAIQHHAPAREGDVLLAMARETSRTGRSGTYQVEIRNQNQSLIAEFQGLARLVRGEWVQAFAP